MSQKLFFLFLNYFLSVKFSFLFLVFQQISGKSQRIVTESVAEVCGVFQARADRTLDARIHGAELILDAADDASPAPVPAPAPAPAPFSVLGMCLKSEKALESSFFFVGQAFLLAVLYAKSCSKFNLFTLPSSCCCCW